MRIYWYFNVCQENHITACRVDSTHWNDIEELSSVRRLQFFFAANSLLHRVPSPINPSYSGGKRTKKLENRMETS